ncbi:hypothetical protein SASPL_120459 [Salvia splendens]|uniref:Uncharacterized protein n=1 Tax=Salvia splendens TaxID=180675 RepID=A0A8X8ZVA7_SALSN|nr:hypothetical protein SASPL_120459 [Salvia splendens]
MAETEVSNVASKIIAIEEICGLDMSSNQDLLKPDSNGNNHHNQAHDLDHSYIFVTGADGLPDDTLDDKGVAIGGASVPPPPEDSQYKKVGEFCEEAPHLIEGESGEVKPSKGHSHLVNYITCNHESSQENGQGVQVSVTDSGELNANKIESSLEAEVELVDSDGISESVAKVEGFHVSVADPQETRGSWIEDLSDIITRQVDGTIPEGPGELTFLVVLILSYNKLIGEIPKGGQVQTFSVGSFEGNPGLCGFGIPTSCGHTDDNGNGLTPREHDDLEEKGYIEWEYVCVAIGYYCGIREHCVATFILPKLQREILWKSRIGC